MTKKQARQTRGRPEAAAAVSNPSQDGVGNLEQVRQILFGEHLDQLELRLARLEERLGHESAELRDATDARLEGLEAHMRAEFDTVTDRVKSEQGNRAEALKSVTRELREATRALDKRLARLDDGLQKTAGDLSSQFERTAQKILSQLESRIEELRIEKTDRSSLAALLSEMAGRLSAENSPGSDD